MKKEYRVYRQVRTARGCQSFVVEAENAAEAVELVNDGDGEFEEQEIEVTSLEAATEKDCEEVEE